MKNILFTLLFLVTSGVALSARLDSVFIYQGGSIIYMEAVSNLDSLTFLPLDYYKVQESVDVMEALDATADVSIFKQMIEIAGYQNQLYNATVWAPVNSALTGVNLNDVKQVRRIVSDHITPKLLTALSFSGKDSLKVTMLSGKAHYFTNTANYLALEGHPVLSTVRNTANNCVYQLNGLIPYRLNIKEYIDDMPNGDSVRNYIDSQYQWVYDEAASKKVLDSVFYQINPLLDNLGKIGDEAANLTMLIPTNSAWKSAYEKFSPYFQVSAVLPQPSKHIQWRIFRDLLFSTRLSLPLTDTVLYSTHSHRYNNPQTLFEASISTFDATNGQCVVVNHLPQFDVPAQDVRLEGEDLLAGNDVNCRFSKELATDSLAYQASGDAYALFVSTATTDVSKSKATYYLNDLLPIKYAIYAVFMPQSLGNPLASKVAVKLNYTNSAGTYPTNYVLNPTIETNPSTQTEVLVASDFTFPFIELTPFSSPAESMVIENLITKGQEKDGTFSRNFALDYLLFKPVEP